MIWSTVFNSSKRGLQDFPICFGTDTYWGGRINKRLFVYNIGYYLYVFIIIAFTINIFLI